MNMGDKLKPHPNLKKVYYVYLAMILAAILPPITILVIIASYSAPEAWSYAWVLALTVFLALALSSTLTLYWIEKYYDSIWYVFSEDSIIVERGVWWRVKSTIPYSRIMSVDIEQGPIARMFKIASVYVYTAGYTGPAGGGGRKAEGELKGLDNFLEVRDFILSMIKGKPVFPGEEESIEKEMLAEIRRVREVVEKLYMKQ